MSLITTEEPQRANEDIICYKHMLVSKYDEYHSPFMWTLYPKDAVTGHKWFMTSNCPKAYDNKCIETNDTITFLSEKDIMKFEVPVNSEKDKFKTETIIGSGFIHATLKDTEPIGACMSNLLHSKTKLLFKCHIPKGALIYKNDTHIATDAIVFDELISSISIID